MEEKENRMEEYKRIEAAINDVLELTTPKKKCKM